MISAFGARDDRICFSREIQQVIQKRPGHERHVAGDDHDDIVSGGRQRRVETAKRAAARCAVGNEAEKGPGRFLMRRLEQESTRPHFRADHQDIVGHAQQFRNLPIQDRTAVDHERALVAPAKTGGSAPRENGCGRHLVSILLPV